MQDNHLAEIVGTTTGNNPIGPTGMTPFKLPRSGIVLSLPTEYDERANPLNGAIFQPDYWVENSIDDLFHERDAAFEKALELMHVSAPKSAPLTVDEIKTAISILKKLKTAGQQPGWSKKDRGQAKFENYTYFAPRALTIVTRKRFDSSRYHYTLVQKNGKLDWDLQTAWRTDRHGRITQRYLIPDSNRERPERIASRDN
jgi:hypothetical protein